MYAARLFPMRSFFKDDPVNSRDYEKDVKCIIRYTQTGDNHHFLHDEVPHKFSNDA